jgi:hypothetical protein
MVPRLTLLMSSGSKKKEPRCVCLSEAKASHWQRMWGEVSSSAPHFLHSGLSVSPIKWRCLLRVLCPVRRPVTTLDCILLKDRSLALVSGQGPEINSRACLRTSASVCNYWYGSMICDMRFEVLTGALLKIKSSRMWICAVQWMFPVFQGVMVPSSSELSSPERLCDP